MRDLAAMSADILCPDLPAGPAVRHHNDNNDAGARAPTDAIVSRILLDVINARNAIRHGIAPHPTFSARDWMIRHMAQTALRIEAMDREDGEV